MNLAAKGMTLGDVVTEAAVRNAMVVHAAFGGSTNLLAAHSSHRVCSGARRPTVDDWHEVNLQGAPAGERASQRAILSSDGAGVSCRRRARGDASSAGAQSARPFGADGLGEPPSECSRGGKSERRSCCGTACSTKMASLPMM